MALKSWLFLDYWCVVGHEDHDNPDSDRLQLGVVDKIPRSHIRGACNPMRVVFVQDEDLRRATRVCGMNLRYLLSVLRYFRAKR